MIPGLLRTLYPSEGRGPAGITQDKFGMEVAPIMEIKKNYAQ